MMGAGMGSSFFGIGMILWLGLVVWFVIFTVLIVAKMNRIIELLSAIEKKK